MERESPNGGRIFQINVSNGGVPKQPVRRAAVRHLGVEGDRQRNTQAHGGPDRAVTLFALERIQALQAEGHLIYPGSIGENLTLVGLDWDQVIPGVRLLLGKDVLLEVTTYTSPCNNLVESFSGGDYGRVSQNRQPGWSRVNARVLQEGEIKLGDPVVLVT
jgi:MOSC domain-containing protein YiiM